MIVKRVNEIKNRENKIYKINKFDFLKFEGGKTQLFVKNDLFKYSKYLVLNIPTGDLDYVINDYMTLKLEKRETNVYIKGEKVVQFHSQILNVTNPKPGYCEEGNPIYEPTFEIKPDLQKIPKIDIPLEIMFWAISSNLQEWVDNGYDTRILYYKLAFTLLKKLKEINDPKVKNVFKEEIAESFKNGNSSVIAFLISNYFLEDLNREELEVVFKNFDIKCTENQSPIIRIAILEKLHHIGIFREEIDLERRIMKELKGLSKSELSELFAESFASMFMKEIKKRGKNADNGSKEF